MIISKQLIKEVNRLTRRTKVDVKDAMQYRECSELYKKLLVILPQVMPDVDSQH